MIQFSIEILDTGIKDLEPIEEFGRFLAKDEGKKKPITSSQIRRFFGALKRIQADFDNLKGEIILLEPKLAYAVGKDDKNSKLEDFYKALSPLIRNINENEKRFRNFVSIVEAIVAYHKAQGGK
ncbi:MAG TPA: type III-A CRISPR-associated protein Csm2 [Bacteroidales bacterium]|nr:type III-A CRISPR-associated protein Csm2 [Bacteroidales bacterium]